MCTCFAKPDGYNRVNREPTRLLIARSSKRRLGSRKGSRIGNVLRFSRTCSHREDSKINKHMHIVCQLARANARHVSLLIGVIHCSRKISHVFKHARFSQLVISQDVYAKCMRTHETKTSVSHCHALEPEIA